MQKFIKLLTIFFIPILIGMCSLEFLLRYIPNDYSYKRNYLDVNSNDIEILFLGNSHIYHGINPEYISRKSFNIAHISQSINLDLAILEKYADNWNKLNYIIIPIDYFSIYTTLENSIEKWRLKNYNNYYGIHKNENYLDNLEIFSGKLSKNIKRANRYLINNKFDITCNKFGFGNTCYSKDSNELINSGKTAAIRHTVDIENTLIFSKNIKVIESIIEFSKKKKIKIIFLTCPSYYTYTENLMPVQLNNTTNIINVLSKKSKNTYYYNLLTDKTFVSTDYCDADHLNGVGAKKLTLKIDSIVNSIENTILQESL
jgi:hypothetical protein